MALSGGAALYAVDEPPREIPSGDPLKARSAEENVSFGRIHGIQSNRLDVRDEIRGEISKFTLPESVIIESAAGKVIGIDELAPSSRVRIVRDPDDPTRIVRLVVVDPMSDGVPGTVTRPGEEPTVTGERSDVNTRPAKKVEIGLEMKTADKGRGVLVMGVSPASPGEKAGFKAGDLIERIGEDKVITPDAVNLMLHKYPAQASVPFHVEREEKDVALTLVLPASHRPDLPEKWGTGSATQDRSGASALSAGEMIRDPSLGWVLGSRGKFVTVMQVQPATPAADAGLVPQDAILAVDGQSYADPAATSLAVHQHEAGEQAVLDVQRKGERTQLRIIVPAEKTTPQRVIVVPEGQQGPTQNINAPAGAPRNQNVAPGALNSTGVPAGGIPAGTVAPNVGVGGGGIGITPQIGVGGLSGGTGLGTGVNIGGTGVNAGAVGGLGSPGAVGGIGSGGLDGTGVTGQAGGTVGSDGVGGLGSLDGAGAAGPAGGSVSGNAAAAAQAGAANTGAATGNTGTTEVSTTTQFDPNAPATGTQPGRIFEPWNETQTQTQTRQMQAPNGANPPGRGRTFQPLSGEIIGRDRALPLPANPQNPGETPNTGTTATGSTNPTQNDDIIGRDRALPLPANPNDPTNPEAPQQSDRPTNSFGREIIGHDRALPLPANPEQPGQPQPTGPETPQSPAALNEANRAALEETAQGNPSTPQQNGGEIIGRDQALPLPANPQQPGETVNEAQGANAGQEVQTLRSTVTTQRQQIQQLQTQLQELQAELRKLRQSNSSN